MKRILPYAAMGLLQAAFLIVAFATGYVVRATAGDQASPLSLLSPGASSAYPLLGEVRGLLASHYIGTLPADKVLEYGAIHGLVAAVGDPYTVFVEPPAHQLETQSLQGAYGGVGVSLAQTATGETTVSPLPGSPAGQAGIRGGDVLLAVDDTTVQAGASAEQVTALIRGPIGSPVRLKVRHANGSTETLTVTRQEIQLPSVTAKLIDGHADMGLITISRFSDKTPDELGKALTSLRSQGAQRFILDLRNDGGGILESAVSVAGYFLNGGVVMYETQRSGPEKTYSAPATTGALVHPPLTVLVNHNTASAAEIVAGALLDRGRAPLIGQATYGKGSVQLVYDLSDGSSLHVTAYHWYTPSHRELAQVGLPPTYVVQPATDGSDAELAYAVQFLGQASPTATPQ